MAFGIICKCCGKKEERVSGDDTGDPLLTCEACDEESAPMPPPDLSVHTIPPDTGVVILEADEAFGGLTPKEQAYALALSKADWAGAKICLIQCSPESSVIFALLQLVFSAQPVEALLKAAAAKGLTEDEISQIMIYSAAFYGNVGNYKSFGDTVRASRGPCISP